MKYDIYIYSYYRHKTELYHMLPSVKRFVDYQNLYVVYDDIYYEETDPSYTGPINWQEYEEQIGDKITVVPQSSLYDWQEHDIIRGWYRQQYAKMLLPVYAKTQYNIVCDSDVFFIKPYTAFENDVPILYHDHDYRLSTEYFPFIEKYLLQTPTLKKGTYVGSCSLWDASIINNIWEKCYKLNKKDIIQCVREHIDTSGIDLCFSEFETYGCFAEDSHIIKPKNYEYVINKFVLENIKDTTELLVFSAGMKHYLEWVNEKNSNMR